MASWSGTGTGNCSTCARRKCPNERDVSSRRKQTPFPLALHRVGSVLAVKGSLRRFAPWTAPGRSEGMTVYEGKGGCGPKGNLSVIPDALSRAAEGRVKPLARLLRCALRPYG